MEYTLGLDVGVTSIGWACVSDAVGGKPGRILGSGVRIFPEGVNRDDRGGEISKNKQRRDKRGLRRQLDRKKRRRAHVRFVLITAGLWPANDVEARLSTSDPYRIRTRALTEKLALWEIGLALSQLARRRGFKSNRKTDGGKKVGVVYGGIKELQSEMLEGETVGQFMDRRRQSLGPGKEHLVRIRGRYTLRSMFETEFDRIYASQQKHHPRVLTNDLKERLRTAIFYQRPLKPSDELVGFCELEPGQRRCPSADRVAQRFRLLVEVNNLLIISPRGEERPLTAEQRKAVATLLSGKEKATFDQIRKACKITESERFNLENGKREYLWGHRTDHELRHKELFGSAYDTLGDEQKDRVVALVLDEPSEEKVFEVAKAEFKLDDSAAQRLARTSLQKGYLSFSRKALLKLLPFIEQGMQLRSRDGEASAFGKAGYLGRDQRRGKVLDRLDAPPGDIRNPIVLAALHQVKRLVNTVIGEFGKPKSIHVELAREAQGSIDQRNERTFENAKRRKRNESIKAKITELTGWANPSSADVQRYKLWEDFNGRCPYTDTTIPAATVFSSEYQVDHILPYSRSLDDSYANKVLCAVGANAEKGNQTVHEWLADRDTARYERVLQNVRHLWGAGQAGKARKFSQKSCELDDFIKRQLNDTAYITRQLAQYLQRLGVDVVCIKGQTTSDLRWRWGLDTVLRDDGLELKNRGDHRHHAVDAIVIALTDPSRLQALSHLDRRGLRARRAEQRLTRRETAATVDAGTGEVLLEASPWQGFRAQVEKSVNAINVSHRPKRRVSGELHEETVYGRTANAGEFVYRKPLASLTGAMVPTIRDAGIRRLVEARLRSFKIDPADTDKIPAAVWKEPLLMPSGVPVRTVRLLRSDLTIKPLKAAGLGAVKPGSNHHVLIFERKDEKGKVGRHDVWVSRLEAARRVLGGEPIIDPRDPDDAGGRLVMVLCPGDPVLADFGEGERLMVFKTGASTQGQLYFADARDARKGDEQKKYAAKANTTTKRKVRPVSVDLLGRIRDRYRHVPSANAPEVPPAVAELARAVVAAGHSNTAAHKQLRTRGLGKHGGALTAELKRLRAASVK